MAATATSERLRWDAMDSKVRDLEALAVKRVCEEVGRRETMAVCGLRLVRLEGGKELSRCVVDDDDVDVDGRSGVIPPHHQEIDFELTSSVAILGCSDILMKLFT
jgi:hypothetical protein